MDSDKDIFPLLLISFFTLLVLPMIALEYGIFAFAIAIIASLLLGALLFLFLYHAYYQNEEIEQEEILDPVTELQQQYAKGNLSEREFEEKLDKLIESQEQATGEDTIESKELELES